MGKRVIRLTENDLHRVIKEAVNEIINNNDDNSGEITPGMNLGIMSPYEINNQD